MQNTSCDIASCKTTSREITSYRTAGHKASYVGSTLILRVDFEHVAV